MHAQVSTWVSQSNPHTSFLKLVKAWHNHEETTTWYLILEYSSQDFQSHWLSFSSIIIKSWGLGHLLTRWWLRRSLRVCKFPKTLQKLSCWWVIPYWQNQNRHDEIPSIWEELKKRVFRLVMTVPMVSSPQREQSALSYLFVRLSLWGRRSVLCDLSFDETDVCPGLVPKINIWKKLVLSSLWSIRRYKIPNYLVLLLDFLCLRESWDDDMILSETPLNWRVSSWNVCRSNLF